MNDLAIANSRWPRFAPEALAAGSTLVQASIGTKLVMNWML